MLLLIGAGTGARAADKADQHVQHLQDRLKSDVSGVATAQPKTLSQMTDNAMPKVPLHTEFVVETNKKGQVVRVRSGKGSKDQRFNAQTYGNALQSFIRTPTGNSDAGTFRLVYDYSPTNHLIRRDVELLSKGGVDPNALGAVDEMHKANTIRSKSPANAHQ